MSGGVDSSVAALLLKQQGYEVIGLYMRNWEEDDDSGACSGTSDYDDVAYCCAKIDIPFYGVNFAKEYRERVFADFLREYEAGNTPNPDILCNREIKFRVFFDQAMSMGADYLATGHYAKTLDGLLYKAQDAAKDQSYFLSAVSKEALSRVLFPLGGLLKSEVREIARQHGLPTHAKKDSTGICFIGERKFQPFLARYISSQKGQFKTPEGEVVGEHLGACFYTLGQRKHLGLGGEGPPWYVVGKDMQTNSVFVARDHDHPLLFSSRLVAENPHWIGEGPQEKMSVKAKVRYRQADQECEVNFARDGKLEVEFAQPQRAATPGQTIAFYQGDRCLGGATIRVLG